MRRPYQILLPLLSLFLTRVDLTDLFPLNLRVKLLKVYDGDTVLVGRGKLTYKIRLGKIDAPEKGQPFLNGSGDAGKISKECLEKIINIGSSYDAQIFKQDIYGRFLGDLSGVSFQLITNGCATLYPYAQFNSIREKFLYLTAIKKAKGTKRGLWKFGGFRQPKLWRKTNKRIGHQRWRQ